MKRNIYLKKKTLEEAKEILSSRLAELIHLETETVPVTQAAGRVLAEPLFAKISSPPFHCAAMDGIAVKAETTYGASEESPRTLQIGKDAFFVNTGNPIPPETDAVIMIEDLHLTDSEKVEIREGAHPWQHVRSMGEDLIATEMAFLENHQVTPYDLGALLACGHHEIKVKKRPRVAILPTGSELLEPGQSSRSTPIGRSESSNPTPMS